MVDAVTSGNRTSGGLEGRFAGLSRLERLPSARLAERNAGVRIDLVRQPSAGELAPPPPRRYQLIDWRDLLAVGHFHDKFHGKFRRHF
jgi:hypothetical protein